jgi:hypothetical protein
VSKRHARVTQDSRANDLGRGDAGLVPEERISAADLDALVGSDLWGVVDWREEREPIHPAAVSVDEVQATGDDGEMGKTPIAAVLVVCLSGCSLAFMEKLPSDYDGKSQPRCTSGKGLIYLDGFFATVDIVANLILLQHQSDTGEDMMLPIAINAADGILHSLSAMSGESWVKKCRAAQDAYAARGAGEDGVRRPSRELLDEDRVFFCTSSPIDTAIGACNRDVATCEESQRRLVAAGHDVGPCNPAPGALCFAVLEGANKRRVGCAPTVKACERQREWAMAKGPAEISDCENSAVRPATYPTPERVVEYCYTIDDGPPQCSTSEEECNEKRESGPTMNVSRCEVR